MNICIMFLQILVYVTISLKFDNLTRFNKVHCSFDLISLVPIEVANSLYLLCIRLILLVWASYPIMFSDALSIFILLEMRSHSCKGLPTVLNVLLTLVGNYLPFYGINVLVLLMVIG